MRKINEKDKDFLKNFLREKYKNFFENMAKITENDEIFVYTENNASGILFLGLVLQYAKTDKIFVNILEPNDWRFKLGMYRSEEIFEKFFKQWKLLTEDEKNFYKNLFTVANDKKYNNSLRIFENNEIKILKEDHFDEKILDFLKKISPKKAIGITKLVAKILGEWNFPHEIWNDTFFVWRIEKMGESGKILFTEMKNRGAKIPAIKEK